MTFNHGVEGSNPSAHTLQLHVNSFLSQKPPFLGGFCVILAARPRAHSAGDASYFSLYHRSRVFVKHFLIGNLHKKILEII